MDAQERGSGKESSDPPLTSELLAEIREQDGGERISMGEIADATDGRAFGLLILILSLPETIPMIGLSAVLAAPIVVLGVSLLVRGDDPPLPAWVQRRTLPRDKVQGAIRRTRRIVAWLDRVSRPRWPRLAHAARLQGLVCVAMGIVLAIPFPGINIVAAAAVAGTGIGVLQRDGVMIAGATAAALVAAVLFGVVGVGAWSVVGDWIGG